MRLPLRLRVACELIVLLLGHRRVLVKVQAVALVLLGEAEPDDLALWGAALRLENVIRALLKG